jgi:hypothetical protein
VKQELEAEKRMHKATRLELEGTSKALAEQTALALALQTHIAQLQQTSTADKEANQQSLALAQSLQVQIQRMEQESFAHKDALIGKEMELRCAEQQHIETVHALEERIQELKAEHSWYVPITLNVQLADCACKTRFELRSEHDIHSQVSEKLQESETALKLIQREKDDVSCLLRTQEAKLEHTESKLAILSAISEAYQAQGDQLTALQRKLEESEEENNRLR